MASIPASGPAAACGEDVVVLEAEEGGVGSSRRAEPPLALMAVEEQQDYRALECRCFWKAGSYEVPSRPSQTSDGLLESSDFDRARVHPKFLHTNATSHKWAFGVPTSGNYLIWLVAYSLEVFEHGILLLLFINFLVKKALAELLDNAVDEVFSTLLTTIYDEKASESSSIQSLLDS
ncbi:putative protein MICRORCHIDIA 2 [Cocos nucifera]|uniref:Uncharacterized protein n=1 Tax=Cocos nucifera TaxID=13894 RepID=A0A8K0IF42_COCNU|nr:putative protein MICRORCHIDIA 2 [Cocos nucifera]